MTKIILFSIFVLGLILIAGCTTPKQYDSFAKCLTEKGVKMYGAYWCPHCTAQKELFGTSFEHVDYIECSLPEKTGQTQECTKEGIKMYPTWEFADGERIEGTMSLEKLSQKSGCELE